MAQEIIEIEKEAKASTGMFALLANTVFLLKKIRLDIAVNDDFVEATIQAIIKGARTGKIGDGKIWVLPLEQCIRIRTGERGSEAIG